MVTYQNMVAYHGTDIASANHIIGPPSNIDVTRGGGELGRGFYLGESVALAAALSRGKFGMDGVVLKFEINETAYAQLNTRVINRRVNVYEFWRCLINRGLTRQHLYNVDVVCAPFATIDISIQYKFESQNAQATLNNNSTKHIL
jgi:hypothetical protein